jgi:SAM-dependent methyltransferase
MYTYHRLYNFLRAQISMSPRNRLSQLPRYRSVSSLDKFIYSNSGSVALSGEISVDLGSNDNPKNPFLAPYCIGVDHSKNIKSDSIIYCDIFNSSLPFQSETVAVVTAFDFIEHVPRVSIEDKTTRLPFIDLMNEIYRILLPNGLFLSYTPAYPFKEAFQDPTHVNIITEDTFPAYFCTSGGQAEMKCHSSIYGFNGCFELIDQAWHGYRLISLLRKS